MARLAFFISAHGFGHAARAAAVMEALTRRRPGLHFEVFTTTPQWFFAETLPPGWRYHHYATDVGLVQRSPFSHDLTATAAQLNALLPYRPEQTAAIAGKLGDLGCDMVVCDIAPVGIVAARRAGIPSILVENFTWDWIYDHYRGGEAAFGRHAAYLRRVFASADFHVQTEPLCQGLPADLTVGPICRRPRLLPDVLRRKLEVPADSRLVLIATGGVPWRQGRMSLPTKRRDLFFVVPGDGSVVRRKGNQLRLPQRSGVYHPDLVHAADAVIGKAGYSTIAEVYLAGVPFGYMLRENFPENAPLEAYIHRQLQSLPVPARLLRDGLAAETVDALLALPRLKRAVAQPSDRVAAFVLEKLAAS